MNAESWDRSVSIAMGYELDDQNSVPSRGKNILFSITSSTALGPTHHPIQWVTEGLTSGVKVAGA
jgi:hypothetical protein